MNKIQQKSMKIIDLGRLVIISMFMIVFVMLIAKSLIEIAIGAEMATVGSYVVGIATTFAIVVSKEVREELLSLGKKSD